MEKHTYSQGKQAKKSQPSMNNEVVHTDPSKKLACWFYSLATIYYFIVLADKIVAHVNWSYDLNDFAANPLVQSVLQVITIALMLLRKR